MIEASLFQDYYAKVIEHSVNDAGEICISAEMRYPRFIHAEVMTHRILSKSSASSRAIPVKKMLKQVWHSPAMPLWWGKAQSGMQAKEELPPLKKRLATWLVYYNRFFIVAMVWCLLKLGLHKQSANRYLEPWLWHTIIITGTDWSNFFSLRYHPDAQPELKHAVGELRKAIAQSIPKFVKNGDWGHLPYVSKEERESLENTDKCLVSVGRSCRVSYLTHDGKKDTVADMELAKKVASAGHFGALEHTAQACPGERHGNLIGWKQFRKTLPGEYDFGLNLACQKVLDYIEDNKLPLKFPLKYAKKVYNRYNFELTKDYPLKYIENVKYARVSQREDCDERFDKIFNILPDYYYVIITLDPLSEKNRLDLEQSEGAAYRCFLVPVPGVDYWPIYNFTARLNPVQVLSCFEIYKGEIKHNSV